MSDRVILNVGTKRGLFVLESGPKRDRWKLRGPFLKGWAIYHATVDQRGTPRIVAAACSDFVGTTVFTGDLAGRKFVGAKKPPAPPKLPPKALAFVKKYGISATPRVWHVEPGHASQKNVLYAGTAPAALFRSEDGGLTWDEVKSLTNHPTRKDWTPGAGGMCLHSIQIDPGNPLRMAVGISAAGVFRTEDGGRRWKPSNKGLAMFEGSPKGAEVGT